jgi:hypothetical protein
LTPRWYSNKHLWKVGLLQRDYTTQYLRSLSSSSSSSSSTTFSGHASPTFFLHSSLSLLQPFSFESRAGCLHPFVWHLSIYFVVSPLAFLLQNSFLVPSCHQHSLRFYRNSLPVP